MSGDAGDIATDNNVPATGPKHRLRSLADLDGRTAAAKAARATVRALEADLGGADRLSVAERELIQRAALASAMLQDMETAWLSGRGLDVAAYTTLSNTQSRILKMLGLERRSRDVTLDLKTYMEARAAPTPTAPVESPPLPPLPPSPLLPQ
jgi:hypothetical protein